MKNLKVKELIILGIFIIICIISTGLAIYFYFNKEECICNEVNILKENTEEQKENKIRLEVKGEVNKPGVYEVNEGSIIKDIITLADGFTKNANSSNINLSMKVKDEMVIMVYSKNVYKKTNKINLSCKSKSYDISNCITNKESIIIKGSEDNVETSSNLININTASVSELQKLSGIGKTKAEAIVDYRQKNGSFKSIEEIMKVSGIGKSTYEKFKDNITI